MELNLNNIPKSLMIGFIVGFVIGFVVGIVSGGFVFEVFLRSLLSGAVLGGTIFGVEQLLKRFAPEIFEESSNINKIDFKEGESEESDITLNDIYSKGFESSENIDLSNNEIFEESDIEKGINFSEENVLRSDLEHSEFESKSEFKGGNFSDSFEKMDFESVPSTDYSKPSFEATDFSRLSSAELGVTKESRGGITDEYIIPPKGQKPIPKDYEKLAEVIRTKLKEE
ncbi:MAG: hypothetical protein ACP5PT_07285 [Brevinematia bacterium]